jgi:hypothetical protein|tara:strand:- start:4589 stop:4951 length:363 start_codon:yes stop_codon:yes gene_type:complete
MKINEIMTESIKEGVIQIWGRNKGKMVRKYRCTSGSRKGRIVAQPSTCNAQKRVGSAINIKRAKARKASVMKVKTARIKRAGALTKRLTKANKPQTQKKYKRAPTRRKKFRTGRKIPRRK